jgi:TPR repeat protein
MNHLLSVRFVVVVLALGLSLPLLAGPMEDAKFAFDRGDYATALPMWHDLAEQGNAIAQNTLGVMYRDGLGITQNETAAVSWFRKATEQGNAIAQDNLGGMYAQGRGVAKDDAEAVQWYRKAAEQGNASAETSLGYMYETGRGVTKDKAQAVQWYHKAAEQGDSNAQAIIRSIEARRDLADVSPAIADARAAFDRGDYATALPMWHDLAAQGNAEAQYFLGSMYGTGRGVSKDYAEAARWIRQAADQGFAPAQYDLGIMYRDGVGVAKDDAETMRWYRKAADQGFAAAQHNLGVRYEGGVGITKDEAEAARWYRKAAEQGRPNSQFRLGAMYADGRGVSRDPVKAYKWLSLSAQGFQGPARAEVIGRRDQLAKAMIPDQIAQAEQLAAEWKPTGVLGSPYSSVPFAMRQGQESAVAEGQPVDLASYTVSAPLGEGWKMRTDQHSAVEFRRSVAGSGIAVIAVAQQTLNPDVDTRTDDGIITTVQRFEEKNMRERGATRSYILGEVQKKTETVSDKQLYVMRYVITDRSGRYTIEMKYAMYVYLPPDVKQTRRVYLFLVGQPQKIGESEIKNDLTTIYPTISSFHEK